MLRPGGQSLTTKEVALLFHVSPSTIINWADEGKLPCVRTLGGHRRFLRSDIEAVIATSSEPGAGDEVAL